MRICQAGNYRAGVIIGPLPAPDLSTGLALEVLGSILREKARALSRSSRSFYRSGQSARGRFAGAVLARALGLGGAAMPWMPRARRRYTP
jgi:hypothetical protein